MDYADYQVYFVKCVSLSMKSQFEMLTRHTHSINDKKTRFSFKETNKITKQNVLLQKVLLYNKALRQTFANGKGQKPLTDYLLGKAG